MSLKSSTFTLVAVCALLAIPAIASMHAGNNDPNVIHACVGNASKLVRIVGAAGSCITSPASLAETAVHWDIQGPPGTNGVNGTNGTAGSSVTFVGYFTGAQYGCPNGGAIYASSTGNSAVCNGLDASALPPASAPCFDDTNRYVDCGNGTVTDTTTGLLWLKQWTCIPVMTWASANQAAAAIKSGDCGLTDNSIAGDWRLPTSGEWAAMIARALAMGCSAPALTNNPGTGCFHDGPGSSFVSPAGSIAFWSSSSPDTNPLNAVFAFVATGVIAPVSKVAPLRAWPVRAGGRSGG